MGTGIERLRQTLEKHRNDLANMNYKVQELNEMIQEDDKLAEMQILQRADSYVYYAPDGETNNHDCNNGQQNVEFLDADPIWLTLKRTRKRDLAQIKSLEKKIQRLEWIVQRNKTKRTDKSEKRNHQSHINLKNKVIQVLTGTDDPK